jgi:hypothetical protein
LASRTQASAGTKEANRNKIPEISDAPLTEQTIVVVALFPFAGRGWMQKKPFERVFQTPIIRAESAVEPTRELLAPVYGWFTEGFDTRDLKDAKALLEEPAAYRVPFKIQGAHAPKARTPVVRTAPASVRTKGTLVSGRLSEGLVDTFPDRLRGFGRNLLSQRR